MKDKNTLGLRIQEGRRAAELSQEALGEQLGVSRQAVSKWEADAAVPELENLIAMSRLFGVTVGQLLGVEEAETADLSEKDLKMAETIAAQYTAGSRRQKLAVFIGGILLVLLLLLMVGLAVRLESRLETLDRAVGDLQGRVMAMESSISAAGQNGTGADSESSTVLSWDAAYIAMTPGTETVELQTTTVLREWVENTDITLEAVLPDGTIQTLPAGHGFPTNNWQFPMQEGSVEFYLVQTMKADIRRREYLGVVDLSPAAFMLSVEGCWDASCHAGSSVSLTYLAVHIEAASDATMELAVAPETVELCIYRNGETPPETVYPLDDLPDFFQQNGMADIRRWTGYETTVKLADGDTVVTALRLRDNYGRTTYTPVNAWRRTGSDIEAIQVPEGWRPWDPLESYAP